MSLSLLYLFCSSLVVALSGAVMPGPVLTAVVSESSRRGAIAGPLFMTGHSLLELVLVIAIGFGLGPWLALRSVFIVTAVAGGTLMLLMALSMLRSLPSLELRLEDTGKRYGRVLGAAIALSLSNPYWTIWWVTIGLGWLQRSSAHGHAGTASFYLGHISGDFLWYTLVSWAVARGRRFLTTPRYRAVIGLCAVLLAYFAVTFLWSGGKELLRGNG